MTHASRFALLAALAVAPAVAQAQARVGADSARVTAFLNALAAADPLVCELVSDQMGNFWWSDQDFSIGRVADARASQRAAKDSISRSISDPGAIRVLSARLAADDPCVRVTAAKLLGNSSITDAALGRLLDAESARVREAALRAVGSDDRAALRGQIERMLGAREPAVAAMAAWALGEIEHRGSVPALRRALAHDVPQVRLTAAWALGNIEDVAAVADLEGLIGRDADRRVRLAAIDAVGEIGQRRSLDVLLPVLEGRDLEMSVAAAEAIDDLGDLDVAPAALVRAAGSAHRPLQLAALAALLDIEDAALIPVFLPHIGDADPEIRESIIEALGELKAREAIPAIRRALNDSVPEVRRAAIEALAEINDR